VIRTIKDPVTQMAAFKAGEIDFIADFSADHVDTIRGAEPARPDHDRERDDADGRDDEGSPCRPMASRCPRIARCVRTNPAKAKAMLAEAGYGPQKPLSFELMTNTEKSVFNVIATVIKEQMARIGVTANLRLVDKVSWMNTATQDFPSTCTSKIWRPS
jgi:ABC-type transport system substrate-binding protein